MRSRGSPRPTVFAASLFAASALAVGGCARADNAAERHIAELRDAIGQVQEEQDRAVARLGGLDGLDAATAPAPAAERASPPPPRTVQLDDTAERADEDPNAPGERPEIRVHGPAAALRGRETRPRSAGGKERR